MKQCSNCKYFSRESDTQPCRSCNNLNNWVEDEDFKKLNDKIKILEKQNSNILSEYETIKKERDELIEFKLLVKEHQSNDFLYYDPNVENFIASCVNDLPIVIRVDDLRLLLSKS